MTVQHDNTEKSAEDDDQADREAYAYMRISELEEENLRLKKEIDDMKKKRA